MPFFFGLLSSLPPVTVCWPTAIPRGTFCSCGGLEIIAGADDAEYEWRGEGVASEVLDTSSVRRLEPRLAPDLQQAYSLPDMAQVATGIALAFTMRREPRVAMTYFGEGATANGQCHEALNFAGVHRLPVVFVLENNKFAYSTPTDLEYAVDPVRRAEGYGFPGVSVDGNDVEAVFESARVAVDRARAGHGPTLIECHTMRMHGHGEAELA